MASYRTFTHTGTHALFDGTPAAGTIEIIPSEKVVKDSAGNTILSGRVKVDLDDTGHYSVALPDPPASTGNTRVPGPRCSATAGAPMSSGRHSTTGHADGSGCPT